MVWLARCFTSPIPAARLRLLMSSARGIIVVVATTGSVALHAGDDPDFSRYRALTLGASVPAAVEALKARSGDVKIVQARPTLIEELTWRQQRYISGASVVVDPLDEIVLTFHRGQLARIDVSYDKARIEGLTDADLTTSISEVYGVPLLAPSPTATLTATSAPASAVIGLWGDGDTLVTLRRGGIPSNLRLTVAAVVADAALKQARVAGVQLAAAEAPARDLANRAAAAAAAQSRAEQVRRDNKASFRP